MQQEALIFRLFRQWWWKILAICIMGYVFVAGFLMEVPRLERINESIRNLYFHVPMWFGMTIILGFSVFYSLRYLTGFKIENDILAKNTLHVGVLMGVLGYLTGFEWAIFTWPGEISWGTIRLILKDDRLIFTAVAMLIYFSYLILRNSVEDESKRAKIAAVYNIFAFAALIPLFFVLPQMSQTTMHPGGEGGSPVFNRQDLNPAMRLVFYPAVIGWTMLGLWLASVSIRFDLLKRQMWIRQHN